MVAFEKDAPNLKKVAEHISAKSPFQKKAVNRLLESAGHRYIAFAEEFVNRLNRAVDRGESHEYLADAYLAYTKSIRVEEMYFAKEGRYRHSDFQEVYKQVYSRDDYMFDYVVGLGMTQIFWPNHYAIVRFFLDTFIPKVGDFETGAEAGVGHGLFHSELLRGAPKMKTALLDISPVSLKMTLAMIEATGIDTSRTTPKLCDVQREIPLEDGSVDALLLGELIEHIQSGEAVMSTMSKKMKPSGYCFFTSAANSPAEDHILLFRTIEEIRRLLDRCGWKVNDEHLGTLGGMSVEEAERGGHNINYAAVLSIK
jgi:hypothetical protein